MQLDLPMFQLVGALWRDDQRQEVSHPLLNFLGTFSLLGIQLDPLSPTLLARGQIRG